MTQEDPMTPQDHEQRPIDVGDDPGLKPGLSHLERAREELDRERPWRADEARLRDATSELHGCADDRIPNLATPDLEAERRRLAGESEPRPAADRPAGDDVIVPVRVRRANLPALQAGITLGVDALTREPIEIRFVPRPGDVLDAETVDIVDPVHDLETVTNPLVMLGAPDPVGHEHVPRIDLEIAQAAVGGLIDLAQTEPRHAQVTVELGAVVLTHRQIGAIYELPDAPHVVALVQNPKNTDVIVDVHDGRRWRVEVDGNVHPIEPGEATDAA